MTLREIHILIQQEQNFTADQSVELIAKSLNRSKQTVYGWLGGREIPDTLLELLNLKLKN